MTKRFTHDHLVGAFHIWHRSDQVEISWESHNTDGSQLWRLARSEKWLSPPAEPLEPGARLIMESDETHVIDEEVSPGTVWFYTLFARRDGHWVAEVEARVLAGERFSWLHPDRERRLAAEQDVGRDGDKTTTRVSGWGMAIRLGTHEWPGAQ